MRWPNFEILKRALGKINFRPELVALPGRLAPPERFLPPTAAPRRQASATTLPAAGTTPTPQAHSRKNQAQEHNPHPAPQMQIRPGFRIRTAINEAAANGVNIPQTNGGRHICLLYRLKGVCNTHCGGRNLHRPLSQIELGRIGKWRNRYCGGYEAQPVWKVDTGRQSQVSTLSA